MQRDNLTLSGNYMFCSDAPGGTRTHNLLIRSHQHQSDELDTIFGALSRKNHYMSYSIASLRSALLEESVGLCSLKNWPKVRRTSSPHR